MHIKDRYKCPCCGYPTLQERRHFDVCNLCDWEDDGQEENELEIVYGGPNGEYSLAMARANFKHHLHMYDPHTPEEEQTLIVDRDEERAVKSRLMELYKIALDNEDEKEIEKVEEEILSLEKMQREVLEQRLNERSEKLKNEKKV